jgi:outer membrane protein assembly factor BamD
VYLKLGLVEEAKRTAAVLGYNYPGSPWYEAAYNKLKAHNLITNPGPAAAGATNAALPPPRHHHWFWIF